MPVYEIRSDAIPPLQEVPFAQLGLKERSNIQRLLRECIDVISPDTLVISEEFSSWSESNRRIDLLGVHKSGDLVVIELKRDDAGHMELQARASLPIFMGSNSMRSRTFAPRSPGMRNRAIPTWP